MSNKKGFIPLIFLIVILVIAAGGGAYYFAKQKQAKSVYPISSQPTATQNNVQSTSTSPTQTQSSVPADWKTYRNDTYGFEFKYPPNFSLEKDEIKSSTQDSSKKKLAILDLVPGLDALGNRWCVLVVEVGGKTFTPDDTTESFKMNSLGAYRYSDYSMDTAAEVVYIPHGNDTVILTFSDCSGTRDEKNVLTYEDNILSTFTFINSKN